MSKQKVVFFHIIGDRDEYEKCRALLTPKFSVLDVDSLQEIIPGKETQKQMAEKLVSANAVVILVSPELLADEGYWVMLEGFCYSPNGQYLIREGRLCYLLLSYVDIEEDMPYVMLRPLINGKPLPEGNAQKNRNKAMKELVNILFPKPQLPQPD